MKQTIRMENLQLTITGIFTLRNRTNKIIEKRPEGSILKMHKEIKGKEKKLQ